MAERLIKPQAFNTLTSFYKNKAQKAVKNCVCKQIIWFYYGTSELPDGNKFPQLYDGKQEEEKTIVDQTWLYRKKKIFSAIRQQ